MGGFCLYSLNIVVTMKGCVTKRIEGHFQSLKNYAKTQAGRGGGGLILPLCLCVYESVNTCGWPIKRSFYMMQGNGIYHLQL